MTSSRPPSTSLPNHNTKCLVRDAAPPRQVHMKRAAGFQSGIKSDKGMSKISARPALLYFTSILNSQLVFTSLRFSQMMAFRPDQLRPECLSDTLSPTNALSAGLCTWNRLARVWCCWPPKCPPFVPRVHCICLYARVDRRHFDPCSSYFLGFW